VLLGRQRFEPAPPHQRPESVLLARQRRWPVPLGQPQSESAPRGRRPSGSMLLGRPVILARRWS
jgi:hypothetical protein